MYESEEWGPSINGHGWTLWSAWARWEIFCASSTYADLQQAWQHSCCVAAKIQPDGSIPPCYPDQSPVFPDDAWGDALKRHEARMTTAEAGMRFTAGRSMSSMHLFIFAPVAWATTCGFDFCQVPALIPRGQRLYANGDGLSVVALKGDITALKSRSFRMKSPIHEQKRIPWRVYRPRLARCGCNHKHLRLRFVAARFGDALFNIGGGFYALIYSLPKNRAQNRNQDHRGVSNFRIVDESIAVINVMPLISS